MEKLNMNKFALNVGLAEKRNELLEVFDEFDSEIITVSDFGIQILAGNWCDLLTHIVYNTTTGEIEYWAGDPSDDDDTNSEQLILEPKEEIEVINKLLKYI